MKKITINDVIFATATIGGHIAANIRLSGLGSIAEVVRAVKNELGSFSGLLNITMRNMTQGWSHSKSVYLSPSVTATCESVQLTLF